jgi:hypothetical protein
MGPSAPEVSMPGKYDPLRARLLAAADRGQDVVELTFDEITQLVGGLPDSARALRPWWANSSHVQALAWRAAGFHVDQVYLDRGRVRFARGERGGSNTTRRSSPAPSPPATAGAVERLPVSESVDVRVVFQWSSAGMVELDAGGKPVFAPLEDEPGLYRLTLVGGVAGTPPQVYIGETDNLRRRLSSNYRSPGPSQQTSLRVNALLRSHLAAGGQVDLAIATVAVVHLHGGEQVLDLRRKAGRLLAENAALVLAQVTADAHIVNLG